MDAKMLARLGAIVFAAVAITATAIELTRKEQEPSVSGLHRVQGEPVDPLRAELIRCARIGETGPRDPDCLRTWAENRERFIAPGSRQAERLPEASPTSAAPAIAPAAPISEAR